MYVKFVFYSTPQTHVVCFPSLQKVLIMDPKCWVGNDFFLFPLKIIIDFA